MIDVDAEITKLEKENEKITFQMNVLNDKITSPGYEEKVPEKVRKSMKGKLEQYRSQQESIVSAIQGFRDIAS